MSIPNKTCVVHILLQDPLQSLKTACALVDFYNRYSIIFNSLHHLDFKFEFIDKLTTKLYKNKKIKAHIDY